MSSEILQIGSVDSAVSDQQSSEPLRVLLASTEKGWHGGEEQARQLAEGIRRRGHDCRLVAFESGELARRMKLADFEVYTYPRKGWTPRTLWNIRKAVRAFQPHVLHYNDAHAMTTIGLGSVWYPIPARVCTRRVDYQISGSWHYNNLVDRVICISTEIATVCEQGGILPEHIAFAHSGVDPDRMSDGDRARGRAAAHCDDSHKLILSVATLTDHKGHKYLLEAFAEVLKVEPRAILALAGDGDLTDDLKRQAASLGLADRIRFLGYRDDIPDLMAACDLFVISSQMEGLCTSIIDAMIAERPIVATRAGGIPDLTGESYEIETSPICWMAEPKHPADLSRALIEALTAPPEDRESRVQRAKARALRLFTSNRMVDENLRIYRNILMSKMSKVA